MYCLDIVSDFKAHDQVKMHWLLGLGKYPLATFEHHFCIMRKRDFCICKNNGADQLRRKHASDQCLYLSHIARNIDRLYRTLLETLFYNAITLNKREIDRVYKIELYIATVSIKQKAVDRIKTALRFWFKATQLSTRMTPKTTTFVTSISAIVMERYVNEQTDEKKVILQ